MHRVLMTSLSSFFAPLVALITLFAGCAGRTPVPAGAPHREVRVDWLGKQSFRITSALGTSIITNPFTDGFPADQRPDIVLITTNRVDSNNVDAFDNKPTVFRGAVGMGLYSVKGTRIRGIPIYMDQQNESTEGMSLAFLWRMEGMHLCFIDNLQKQSELTSSQMKQIGPVDVLLVPSGDLANAVASQLRAKVIIPIGPDAATTANSFPRKLNLPGSSVFFSAETLPEKATAIVFDHPTR